MAVRSDLFVSPDYYQLDDLLTEEQKHIREAVRNYVKKEISPIIEDFAQRAEFPQQIVKQLGDLGCFGPTIPAQYGGGGLDYISYGLMMQELERGDSGVRSTASVQGSLVMFPIHAYGSEEQRKKYLPKPNRWRYLIRHFIKHCLKKHFELGFRLRWPCGTVKRSSRVALSIITIAFQQRERLDVSMIGLSKAICRGTVNPVQKFGIIGAIGLT